MQALAQLVRHFLHAVITLVNNPGISWPVFAAMVGTYSLWLRKRKPRAEARVKMRAAQDWLSVPATIDVVCVTEREESERKFRFAATLTYFYNNPDLQMGEYEREFPQKAAAEQCANQFKGCR